MFNDLIEKIKKDYYLLVVLVNRDITKKYKDSFLGFMWTFLNPLLNMAVLSIIFSTIFKKSIDNFPVYMLSGRVFYDFFSRSTNDAMKSIPGSADIIKKIYVPKYIVIVSKVFSNFVISAVSLAALVVVMLVTGAKFSASLIIVPVLFLIFFIFAVGVSLMIATLDVFFRDIEHVYSIFMMTVMYFSAIFYPADIIPERYQAILWYNPMFRFVEAFRAPIYYGTLPDSRLMLYCAGIALAAFVVGVLLLRRNQEKFIYYL